jgi:hypothetical protein
METKLINAIQKKAGAADRSLNGYFDYLLDKTAEDNGVVISRASNNTKPSAGSVPGMEDRNLDYGKGTTDNTEPDGKGTETGKVIETHDGQNLTSEGQGMPDLSLPKTATLKQKLQSAGLANKLRAMGA